MNIGKLKRSTQIAIMTGAGSGQVEKTASGTAPITLSDSVAGSILGITINGRSAVSAGSIVSVGDNGLTVTTTNSDSTVTTSAVVTTALPLRGGSDTVRDTLTCTAESKQVETFCGEIDLGTLDWYYYPNVSSFSTANQFVLQKKVNIGEMSPYICAKYTVIAAEYSSSWGSLADQTIFQYPTNNFIVIKDSNYTDATDLKNALSGVKLVYELAEPVITPLTDAEISAFRGLKTYDSTTTISVTDNPSITVKYMGKRTTRTAPKKRTSRKKKS